MGKKSKNKGSNYERKVAKLFSEWSGLELRRTPLSGGWARSNPSVTGDLVCITPDVHFPYHIECKNNEAWSWEPTLKNTGIVFKWWEQAESQCPEDKIPLLVFSKAYRIDWLMLQMNHYLLCNSLQHSDYEPRTFVQLSDKGLMLVPLSFLLSMEFMLR